MKLVLFVIPFLFPLFLSAQSTHLYLRNKHYADSVHVKKYAALDSLMPLYRSWNAKGLVAREKNDTALARICFKKADLYLQRSLNPQRQEQDSLFEHEMHSVKKPKKS